MRRRLLLSLGLLGCNGEEPQKVSATPPPPVSPTPPAETACQQMQFAESTPLPEASGAAWMTIDGRRVLVVVSDSGNDGAYAVIDPDTGATRERGKLPLGDAGADNEGAATWVVDGVERLVTLTSSGYVREYTREGRGFALVRPAYPIATPVDGCGPKNTNCGADYEGLCLANRGDPAPDACVGFALSRKRGVLECVTTSSGLVTRGKAKIPVGDTMKLADCAFSDDDTLYVGANAFATNQVMRIDSWMIPAQAKVVEIGSLGPGFAETIAARGDAIYRMSDLGGAPSLMAKYRCPLK